MERKVKTNVIQLIDFLNAFHDIKTRYYSGRKTWREFVEAVSYKCTHFGIDECGIVCGASKAHIRFNIPSLQKLFEIYNALELNSEKMTAEELEEENDTVISVTWQENPQRWEVKWAGGREGIISYVPGISFATRLKDWE